MKLPARQHSRLIGLFGLILGLALMLPLIVHIATFRWEQYHLRQAWQQMQAGGVSTPSTSPTSVSTQPTSIVSTGPQKPNPRIPVPISYPAPILGNISIPRMGLDDIFLEGTSLNILRYGPGHLQGSAYPGQPGNAVIVAHDDLDFHTLGTLKTGDLVYVTTTKGKTLTFRVENARVIGPKDVIALNTPVPTLTLSTCYPFNAYKDTPYRYIVTTRLI